MADIGIVSHDKTGQITFSIDGKRYTYVVDAYHFPSIFGLNKRSSGKALNFVKKNGYLISPRQKPKPKIKYDMPKDTCPNCGSQSHVIGVPCPNCDYNESFSFKKWLSKH